jgi:DNA-binding LytR/AlgR family response regulator
VDDEPPALAVLQAYLAQVPSTEVVGSCYNAIAAFSVLQSQAVDLIFLDIKMPQLLGTDFLKSLRNPPKVIFTTAYAEYALEGYELDVVDYLLKPISLERFLRALQKVQTSEPAAVQPPTANYLPQVSEPFVYFRVDRKMVKVMVRDILYIESLKDYVKVFTTSKQLITKQSISSMEEMLPEEKFIRIHRSYIVALDKIESFTQAHVFLLGKELPIGRHFKHEVEQVLK